MVILALTGGIIINVISDHLIRLQAMVMFGSLLMSSVLIALPAPPL